ncbi:MAG: hypothetical protein WA865_16770 [Spirulinaceae cyanobacterium]
MNTALLRQLWSIVEVAPPSILIKHSDTDLVNWIIQQIQQERYLEPQESESLYAYVRDRIPLIRDVSEMF